MKEDNALTELFNFLKKETPGYNGFMVCQTEFNNAFNNQEKQFVIVIRIKTSNGDSFLIDSRFWHDYGFRWKNNCHWKIIYKYYGEENEQELSDV